MTPPGSSDRLALLFEWAHHDGRRLGLWLLVAALLHVGAYLLFRIDYPRPSPARIDEATLHVLLPGSPEAERLAPFLRSEDPGLFAPERATRADAPLPAVPAYEPSYAAAKPELVPLPDPAIRILPPLPLESGAVPVNDAPATPRKLPAPAEKTQISASASLASRLPATTVGPFSARPGDQLPPTRFLVAVAPDGRVLHVIRDAPGVNPALDDDASRFLMALRFTRGERYTTWGTVTFHWGLDVERREVTP